MKTIFVSSTFKDMHKERDALQKITLPILYEEAKKWGESVEICDLRWGVNTEDMESDAGSTKVLNVCLDEIDHCQPPMVVILGYRYGWIPDEKIVGSAAKRYGIKLDDLEKSVTTLEIEYGALNEKRKNGRTLFYFREIEGDIPDIYKQEDDYHYQKLKELKQRIMKISGGSVKTYRVKWENNELTQIDSFAKMVAEDVLSILKSDWQATASLTPIEKELRVHRLYAKDKLTHFYAKRKEADKLFSNINANDAGALILGESGSGKSTLMAYYNDAFEKKGYKTIPVFSSLTTKTSNAYGVLEVIVEALELQLGLTRELKINTIEELKNRLYLLTNQCQVKKQMVAILVDSLDQLSADENRDQLIFVPTKTSKYVKFVSTATSDFKTSTHLSKYTWKCASDEEIGEIIVGIEKARRRELSKEVKNAVMRKAGAKNPLYLDLLMQRLVMMNEEDFLRIREAGDGMSAITEHQLSLLENVPHTLEEMSVCLFLDSAERINPELIGKCARYLAFSRYGLRQGDLKALLKDQWNGLDFSSFIHYLRDSLFIRADGRVDFVHRSFRQGLCHTLAEEKSKIHAQLLKYISSLENDDLLKAQECAYHAICADNKLSFVEQIVSATKESLSYVASALAEKCLEDEGVWLDELCSYIKENPSYEVLEFLVNTLPSYFGQTKSQLEARARSLYASIKLIESLPQDDKMLELLINAYILLGNVSAEISLGFSMEDMCISYETAVSYAQRLENKTALARAYTGVAKGYNTFSGTEYCLCATEYYQKAIELLEDSDDKDTLLEAYIGMGEQKAGQNAKDYFLKAVALLDEKNLEKESYLIKKAEIYRRLTLAERAILSKEKQYSSALEVDFSSQLIKEIEAYMDTKPVVSYEVQDVLASLYQDIVNTAVARCGMGMFEENDSQASIFSSITKMLGGAIKDNDAKKAYKKAKSLYKKISDETQTSKSKQALAGINVIGLMYFGDLSGAMNRDQAMMDAMSPLFEYSQNEATEWSVFGLDKEKNFEKDYQNCDYENAIFGNLSFLMISECNEGREMLERAYKRRMAILEGQNSKESRLSKYCLLARYMEACIFTDTMRGYLRAQRIGKEARQVIDGLVNDFDDNIYKKLQYITYYRLGCTYYGSSSYINSYDYLSRAREIIKALDGEEPLDIALMNYKLAKIIRLCKITDKYDYSFELMKEAVSIIAEREALENVADTMLSMLGDKSILAPEAKSEIYREMIAAASNVKRLDEAEMAFEIINNLDFADEQDKILYPLHARIEMATAYTSSENKETALLGIDMQEEILDLIGQLYEIDAREECTYEDLKVYDILLSIANGYKNAGDKEKEWEYLEKAFNFAVTTVEIIAENDRKMYYPNALKHARLALEQVESTINAMDEQGAEDYCNVLAQTFDKLKNAYAKRKYFHDKQKRQSCIASKARAMELLVIKTNSDKALEQLINTYNEGLEFALKREEMRLAEKYAVRLVGTADKYGLLIKEDIRTKSCEAVIMLAKMHAQINEAQSHNMVIACGEMLIQIYEIDSEGTKKYLQLFNSEAEAVLELACQEQKKQIQELIETIKEKLN
ncbi:MAG: DUF4062 domain-containing protein [Clostridia bacterium]|nr:DUF4062 domain-containing protein [Clostridia bacterium]